MSISRPIIALDFPDRTHVIDFIAQFPQDEHLFVKVGMELYYSEGADIVRELRAAGHDVFLDLKLFDIPHTVENAMRVLGQLGVAMTTVHALGGSEMLRAARSGLDAGSSGPAAKLLAITQLTSTDQVRMNGELLIPGPVQANVVHLAQLAAASGTDGVVCSALEATAIRTATGADFLRVTPGIRLAHGGADDQARVVTPERAAQLGSSALVVGRPITQAPDPVAVYHTIMQAWKEEH